LGQEAAEKEERNRRRAAAAAAAAPLTFEQQQGRHETVFESADRLAQVQNVPPEEEPRELDLVRGWAVSDACFTRRFTPVWIVNLRQQPCSSVTPRRKTQNLNP
jgi:hypothetical protein